MITPNMLVSTLLAYRRMAQKYKIKILRKTYHQNACQHFSFTVEKRFFTF